MSGWTVLNIIRRTTDGDLKRTIRNKIKSEYETPGRRMLEIGDKVIALTFEGYEGRTDAMDFACDILKSGERFIIIEANDTTESGSGTLYAMHHNNQVSEIDIKVGRDGARTQDVAGYFDDEYNIRPKIR